MSVNKFTTFFRQIIDSLSQYNLPYVLVGGTVMPYFGNIRSTQDIDIMLLLDEITSDKLENWLEYLDSIGMVFSKSEIIYALNNNIHCNIFDPQTFVFRVDLKRINTKLDLLTYEYRQKVNMNNRDVWINCPESQIGVKISPGFRSSTDLEDVQSIIETMDIDSKRLEKFLNITASYNFCCKLLRDFNTKRSAKLRQDLGCQT